MPDSRGIYLARLRSAAEMYRGRGWSVIPIRGDLDPAQPKAAAVEWSQFQHRRAGDAEFDEWFRQKNYPGLAIVCGPVSSLAVLDFDDSACAASFARVCPDLVHTLMIRSGGRALPHYYYHVPGDLGARGKRTPQADFQAGGTYVVAPPTRFGDHYWQVENEAEPRVLTCADVERIHVFLEAYAYHVSSGSRLPGAARNMDFAQVWPESGPVLSLTFLGQFYRRLAGQMGRNNALFRVASLARDRGWSRADAVKALLDLHVVQQPNGPHVVETPVRRRREGLRTIANAFKRPPRIRPVLEFVRGLPNSVREALLRNKQVMVARVLDGLLLSGLRAGMKFTERAACEMLRILGIGRRAVMAALKALSPTSLPVFAVTPQSPQMTDANAAKASETEETKCIFVRGAKRVKNAARGRAPRYYRMPDSAWLCRQWGVKTSYSDALSADDLRSPEAYRRALQRAFVQRRPGRYSRRWLAARLGISVWTSRRYDRRIGVLVEPMYEAQRVSWTALKTLPLEEARSMPDGTFLETEDGRRYPPVRGLAAHLLRREKRLMLKQQGLNYYRMPGKYYQPLFEDLGAGPEASLDCEHNHNKISNGTSVLICASNHPEHESQSEDAPLRQLWLCPDCLTFHLRTDRPATCGRCGSDRWELIPPAVWQDAERCKAWWQALWQQRRHRQRQIIRPPQPRQRPDPAQEALASRLYEQVRRRTPARSLTRRAAHQLVQRYDSRAVETALALLRDRREIRNAAGLVIAVLRSAQRGRAGECAQRKESATPENHAAWIEQLKQSPYARFYANAGHFLGAGENDNVAGDDDVIR